MSKYFLIIIALVLHRGYPRGVMFKAVACGI